MPQSILSPLDIPYPLLKETLAPPLTPGLTELSDNTWQSLADEDDLFNDMGEIGEDEENDIGQLGKLLAMVLEIGEKDPVLLDIVIETAISVRETMIARNTMGPEESLLRLPTPVGQEPSILEQSPPNTGMEGQSFGLSLLSPPPLL